MRGLTFRTATYASACLALFALGTVPPPARDHACRLWGMIGTPPDTTVTDQLVTGTHSFRSLAATNQDGWGLAFQSSTLGWDGPIIQRGGPPANHPHDGRFAEAVSRMLAASPDGVIAHIREASSGHTHAPDPHPFWREGITFAHNGTVSQERVTGFLEQGDPDYLETHPPDYWLPYVDSELYLMYILKIREEGVDREGRTASHALADALSEAVLRIYDGEAMLSAGNCFALGGDTLWALRFDKNDLLRYALRYREVPGGWIVASEPAGTDTSGWETIPPKSLGIFTADAPPEIRTVWPPPGPYLALGAHTIDDDLLDGSIGNGDANADAGERVELIVELRNLGMETAVNVRGTLSTDDPHCTLIDDYEEWGDIASGDTVACAEDFDFYVHPDCPDQHELNLRLSIQCDGRPSWDFYLALPIQAPVLELTEVIVHDTVGGNGNGRLDPGETATVSTHLKNGGSQAASGLSLELQASHPDVTILQGSATLDSLPAGGDAIPVPLFELAIGDTCPDPSLLEGLLAITGDWDLNTELEMDLPVGGFFDDMETPGGGWSTYVVTDGFANDWHLSDARNHTAGGSWSWKFGDLGSGGYADLSDGALEAPPLVLPDSCTLRFWHWMQAEGSGMGGGGGGGCYDGGMVEMSIDGGEWVQIHPVGGYTHQVVDGPNPGPFPAGTDLFSGYVDWTEVVFEINGLEGEARFRFRFGSNGVLSYEGWYIDDVEFFGLSDPVSGVPDASHLHLYPSLGGSRPNPFGHRTVIRFQLPEAGDALLGIYDPNGRRIRALWNGEIDAGRHRLEWDGRGDDGHPVASGVYFCRFRGGGISESRKIVLTR